MITDHFDRQGDARFYGGEPISAELQLLDAGGAVQDLTGRTFALTIFGADRAQLASVAAVVTSGSDSAAAFRLAGAVSNGLIGQADLRYEIAELLADGRDIHVAGRLLVLTSAASVAPAAGTASAPVTRLVRQLLTERPRLIISQRGGMPRLNTFVQPTPPNHPGPYAWWDTSGGKLTLWIEDGL